MSVVSTWMMYPSIAIFRRYASYRFVGSWAIFSSMSRFAPVSHKDLELSQQAIFVFRGRGPPKHKIRQWVLAGCACYRNPSLVFPSTNTTIRRLENGKEVN